MKPAPQEERTFFITTNCYQRQGIFRNEGRARLMLDVLRENRSKGRFLLHEFAVMPDHLHILFTPAPDVSLEKAVQFIKGGFSFRAKKELGYGGEIWQQSFTERRMKDAADYAQHAEYIRMNPVRARLAESPDAYPYSSAGNALELDPCPPWLKPHPKDAETRGSLRSPLAEARGLPKQPRSSTDRKGPACAGPWFPDDWRLTPADCL